MRYWILLLLFVPSVSLAAPYTLKFRNPDATRAYTQLRTPWGTVAAPCAPGATCSVILDLPVGRQTITAEATDGAAWSTTSSPLAALVFPAPADCLLLPACRFDATGDGIVGGDDFKAFTNAFGQTWLPASP